MSVRWTTTAADDLAHIVEYIRKDNPAAARHVAQTIHQGIAGLPLGGEHPRADFSPVTLYRGL
jgi:plasmid stabilization system protein ParE